MRALSALALALPLCALAQQLPIFDAHLHYSHDAWELVPVPQAIEIMRKANKIVHEQVYDNIMYTQNLFFAASDEWSGFISKPSELLSIVNPLSLASAHPVE